MPISMPLFSVEFNADIEGLNAFVDRLNCFFIAVSWGGHESLALPIDADYLGEKCPLVRFYIGLEEADFLIKDIEQALIDL